MALIGCVATFGLATIATAMVHGLAGLTILRFVTGMGTGGALPNASALTAEFAPLRRRAMAVKLTLVCFPLGGMLGGLLAAWVLPRFGWRGLVFDRRRFAAAPGAGPDGASAGIAAIPGAPAGDVAAARHSAGQHGSCRTGRGCV